MHPTTGPEVDTWQEQELIDLAAGVEIPLTNVQIFVHGR